ncbi:hypothetical protein EIP91_011977 [Steccherinum ochraceum]|uniref:F-box domain-containing protein n=1 Tax=Steccherinum ochraceum TaxID=92696 RepID=A0A4R0RNT9_9APHY|nr:hypothetical protein EIP91_011977 [Steccherinum ochraceum]
MQHLGTIPQEVLEQIAFFVATHDELGPPSDIVPLLGVNRRIASLLSAVANPHLYARIFAYKFDAAAPRRRLGNDETTPLALTEELQRRCSLLRRIRDRLDCTTCGSAPASDDGRDDGSDAHSPPLSRVLWAAYFMVLENDGKNERQLREYAGIDVWLREFWFDPNGASGIMSAVNRDDWPSNHETMSLGMWLFWLLLKPEDYMENDAKFREATGILKLVALGAHHYPLCYPSWIEFIPTRRLKPSSVVRHYTTDLSVVAPAPAAPAILSYLTLANKLSVSWESINYMKPLAPTVASSITLKSSREWDGEWARTLSVGDPLLLMGNTLTEAFKPGSLEGVWEGLFTYTEFTAYAALLSGAPPATLQRSLVAQHRQTWKLREYHIYEDDADSSSSPPTKPSPPSSPRPRDGSHDTTDGEGRTPLSPGNPARGYVPNGTEVREGPTSLEIVEPGRNAPIIYQNVAHLRKMEVQPKVKDVFVTGEGHSAWGQFNLLGRVRPCDGFISLSKEYVDGDRGKWLYRGYLVGDKNGNLSGRWRDTLTLPHVAGYEGCFVMSRRR